MQYDYKWLNCSCIIELDKWHLLLKEIQQFIQELNKDVFLFYQIRFNYDYNQNIRFSILAGKEKFEEVAQLLNEKFTYFLSLAVGEKVLTPITSIFLPYPTSTIEFGLYNKSFNKDFLLRYSKEQDISKIIIDALKLEHITQETIITFSFYFHISLVRILSTYYIHDISKLFTLFIRQEEPVSFSDALYENEGLLVEITRDVMSDELFTGELTWLATWLAIGKSLVEKELKNLTNSQIDTELDKTLQDFYKNTVGLIENQLGLIDKEKLLLRYFINRSLTRFYMDQLN